MLREEHPIAAVAGTDDPEAAFALDHGRRLDAAQVEQTLSTLLDTFPEAPVGALTAAGMFLEMPATIALRRNPVLSGRSGLDGMSDDDRVRILQNWDRVL